MQVTFLYDMTHKCILESISVVVISRIGAAFFNSLFFPKFLEFF